MPRRQITDVPTGADELPDLTPNQREFVRLRLAGKTGADAYRGAYDVSGMNDRTIWVEASRVSANPKVSLWLSAARQAHLGTAVLTRDAHIAELDRLKEIALASGNVGAAVKAEELRGKVAGHQVERVQEVPHDPADTLRHIAEHQPDLAAQLAQAHGIPGDSGQGGTKH